MTVKEFVFNQAGEHDINWWLDLCTSNGMDDEEQRLVISCADHFGKITFDGKAPDFIGAIA